MVVLSWRVGGLYKELSVVMWMGRPLEGASYPYIRRERGEGVCGALRRRAKW